MSEGHSSHGPSQWPRLVRCPGSFRASEGLPDEAGWEAAEGTAYHHMLALCLQHGYDPWLFVQRGWSLETDGFTIDYDEEMATCADAAIRMVSDYVEDPEWEVWIEKRVNIANWAGKNQFGTLDFGAFNRRREKAVIIDWKYGQGVPVKPEDEEGNLNEQLLGYALGAWIDLIYHHYWGRKRDFGYPGHLEFELIIEQPRFAIAGGRTTRTLEELLTLGTEVHQRLKASRGRDAPREAGPVQCQFCPAVGKCRENADWVVSSFAADGITALPALDGESLDPGSVTVAERSAALLLKPYVERWFKAIHADAYADALAGDNVPGLKLVPGRRGRRSWIDSPGPLRRLEAHLPDPADAWDTRMISPARAEKMIGKQEFAARFEGMTVQADARPILVPEDDPRYPIVSAVDDLDDLTRDNKPSDSL